MEQHPSYQNTQDFAGLTDALIPANTYMNSWSQSNLPKQSDIQPVSLGLDMYPHPFGDVFPLPNISENTLPRSGQITPFNPASVYSASSTQPLELMNLDQNAETTDANPVGTQYQRQIAKISTATPEGSSQSYLFKDPLAALKMRAKESVLAKRAGSIRSASMIAEWGMQTPIDQSQQPRQSRMMSSRPLDLTPEVYLLIANHLQTRYKSPRDLIDGVEDLLAEGRAAATIADTSYKQPKSDFPEENGSQLDYRQHPKKEISEAEEIREASALGKSDLPMIDQPPPHIDGFPAGEIDEIDAWLAMTGYYDRPYRDKVLSRRRRLKEIEEEKIRLLQEEQDDPGFRGQFYSGTAFQAGQPLKHSAIEMQIPPPSNNDVAARTKDPGQQTEVAETEAPLSDDGPLKRRFDEKPAQKNEAPRSKVARTEVNRKAPLRSKQTAVERPRTGSESPKDGAKQLAGSPSKNPTRNSDMYDWRMPDRERGRRSVKDHLVEEPNPRRKDQTLRGDQHPDAGSDVIHRTKHESRLGRTRFFLLKSWNYENIMAAQDENTWATQIKHEETFVEAFKTCRNVIFFFSANHSKAFQGYARMQGLPGEKGVSQPSWVKRLHWPTTKPFRLRWLAKGDTPYWAVGSLKNPLNEDQPIFVGRDGQEIPERIGLDLCEIIDEDNEYRDRR